MDDNNKLIKCRKCGGNHLTIKCGKEKNKSSEITPITQKFKLEPRDYNKNYNYYEKRYKVKIVNLPNNFEYSEISEFAKDWGHVLKINTKNFDTSSIAVIEFKYEKEADYFIEAFDNTPFEYCIIKATKIEE